MPGSSAGTAIAGWTSSPRPADAAVTATLAKACGIADPLIVDVRGRAGYVVGMPDPGSPAASLHGALLDCLFTVPGDKQDADLRDGWFSSEPAASASVVSAADPLLVLSAKSPEVNGVRQHDVAWVSGRVDASVTRVVVQNSSGVVTATVSGGRFAAWWPGNDGNVAVVRAYGGDGALLSTVDELSCSPAGLFSPRATLPGHQPAGGCTVG